MPQEKFTIYDDPQQTFKVWQRKLEYLFNKNLNADNIASTELTLGSAQVKASNIDFGTGADQVDASDIPIIDAKGYYSGASIEAALQEIGYTVTLTTASITLGSSHQGYVICNASGAITITFPAVSGNTELWYSIRNASTGTGTVILDPATTDLIDNSTSFTLYASESLSVVDDGMQWREG